MSAGAPVPATLLASVGEVLPGASLHTPYGMTEVLPVTDVSLEEIRAAGPGEGVCVGRPLPGVEVSLAPLAGPTGGDDAQRFARRDRRDLRAGRARQGPLRRALDDGTVGLTASGLAPHR